MRGDEDQVSKLGEMDLDWTLRPRVMFLARRTAETHRLGHCRRIVRTDSVNNSWTESKLIVHIVIPADIRVESSIRVEKQRGAYAGYKRR